MDLEYELDSTRNTWNKKRQKSIPNEGEPVIVTFTCCKNDETGISKISRDLVYCNKCDRNEYDLYDIFGKRRPINICSVCGGPLTRDIGYIGSIFSHQFVKHIKDKKNRSKSILLAFRTIKARARKSIKDPSFGIGIDGMVREHVLGTYNHTVKERFMKLYPRYPDVRYEPTGTSKIPTQHIYAKWHGRYIYKDWLNTKEQTACCETNSKMLDLRKVSIHDLVSGICDAGGSIKDEFRFYKYTDAYYRTGGRHPTTYSVRAVRDPRQDGH